MADDSDDTDTVFFALCIETHDAKHRSIDEQNALLSELGFDGVSHLWLDGLAERVVSAKKHALRVVQVYLSVDLTQQPPFDTRLAEVLPCLKGMGSQLALLITGGPPSETSLDDQAVAILEQMIETASKSNVRVVLYPHVNHWLETTDDAVRLASRFPDGDVGVMFNLCHGLVRENRAELESVLCRAMPYLAAVTLNGADSPEDVQRGTGDWILPLDEGNFDILPLLRLLKNQGYRGPIGLQCYGIPGDARIHLERSMAAWKRLQHAATHP